MLGLVCSWTAVAAAAGVEAAACAEANVPKPLLPSKLLAARGPPAPERDLLLVNSQTV
jgi:hypothetical protein